MPTRLVLDVRRRAGSKKWGVRYEVSTVIEELLATEAELIATVPCDRSSQGFLALRPCSGREDGAR